MVDAVEMMAVQSSVIEAIGYDARARELRVQFKRGRLYAIRDVPADVFERFRDAPSKGGFYNFYVRPLYSRIRRLP